jgi:UDP-3-O-[3-hydroxymyristoyl] N-acetylglucosamine deacetylase/3-hydroxyacyl-[acyl-carrier-protein] dehydratase
MAKQKTIAGSVEIHGIGLHTGKEVTLTFHPAGENHGYRFKRSDLENQPIIKADANLVTKTERGTTLDSNGVEVNTTEHVLAALVGLSIDNVLIELNASEPPIMDGSSAPFIKKLKEVGIQEQKAERDYFVVKKTITYSDPESGVELMLVPSDKYQINCMVDYNTKVLNTQHAIMNDISEFESEFASSRTFCFLHELETLIEHNLIKGGDMNNAIVYVDRIVSKDELKKLAKVFDKDEVEVNGDGVLDNLELRHRNEAARHKLLDIVGDLALVGKPIKGRVIATKPGHGPNTNFAKIIKKVIAREMKSRVPQFNLNGDPLLDIHQIMNILPHRPPFLLVDKILELSEEHVVGLKNVTMNEPFFEGHFPGAPVMPGVLQIEAMAQAGGVLILSTVDNPQDYLTYFMKVDKVKFKRKVLPGDTLIFDLKLLSPIRRGICHMAGKAYVGEHVVMEAELMAQIAKKNS